MDNSMERQLDYGIYEIMEELKKLNRKMDELKKELDDVKKTMKTEEDDLH